MKIQPFQGLYPAEHLVHQVASVPYDVVNREEARELAADAPYSLLHIERAEIDLPDEVDPYADVVYETAAAKLAEFEAKGILLREPAPCFYIYRQRMGAHEQTGVAAVCHIDDYDANIIRKHEKTRRDKEDDRTRLIHTLNADTSPVFLTYRDSKAVNELVGKATETTPWAKFLAPDGIEHTVWRVTETAPLADALGAVPVAYVADGHHRAASAARVGRERREANPAHTGEEAYNWFLCVLFPASQLQILPYNRTVADLNGLSETEFLDRVAGAFTLVDKAGPEPHAPGDIRMYLGGGRWFRLSWQPEADAHPSDKLDVAGLQSRLLAPILGIDDPRTSQRIEFIGGIRGTEELERLVDGGSAAVAFSMYPTTVGQLMDIADAGGIMPPKSTWFEPKLRSGLFIHTLGQPPLLPAG